jgi:hypothetical protein
VSALAALLLALAGVKEKIFAPTTKRSVCNTMGTGAETPQGANPKASRFVAWPVRNTVDVSRNLAPKAVLA